MTTLTPGGPGPYTTAQSLITVLDAYRDKGLGVPITSDVLTRAGVAESIAARTLNSSKLLGLVGDDGVPTAQFEDLRKTRDDDEYRQRVQEWLRSVYSDVLQYADPSTDPLSKVVGAFRTYEPAGRRPQMAALLIGLWRYSGLPVPEGVSAPLRTQSRSAAPRASKGPTKARRTPDQPESGNSAGKAVLPPPPTAPGVLFGVTESDIGVLDDDEFAEVWAALGKVARARSRKVSRESGGQEPDGSEVPAS